MRQTTFVRKEDATHGWRHVDASGKRLGRLAAEIAPYLMGKHRPDYTPHVDLGDFIVVTNAEKIEMSGRKFEQRTKSRYSGYPGGLKVETYASIRDRKPEALIEDAVRRMLPKGILGRKMLTKLKVYKGADHPHQAQNPTPLEV